MKCVVAKAGTALEQAEFQISLSQSEVDDIVDELGGITEDLRLMLAKTVKDHALLQNSFWDSAEGTVSEESNV